MSLGKRHIGRRVAGVGVAVALMVLGLEAPAFAAAPVISSFSPTSGGPDTGGCVVVVTGTGLDDFADDAWEFVAGATSPNAPDAVLVSDTEAWVTTPALVAGTAYNIKVTNSGGTSTSTGTYLATVSGGACAPTITSVTPNCGVHNDKVVITGTNLLKDPTPAAAGEDIAGGTVQFTPFSDTAAVVPPDSDTSTTLTRFVSTNAADGPVKVIAGGGTGFSGPSFEVPPPDCTAVVEGHPRAITFKIKKTGKASGVVSSTEDPAFTDCVAAVPVKIQKKKKGDGWKTKATATTTDTGSYSAKTSGKPGKYRALAPKVEGTTDADDCLKTKSATRKIG